MLDATPPALPQAFAHSLGPRNAKLAFVGEAWGQHEDMFKRPLVWWSGVELARMLGETGHTSQFILPTHTATEPHMISHWLSTGYFFTNTFAERPPGQNDLDQWLVDRKAVAADYLYPPLKPGKFIREDKLHHVTRLMAELAEVRPNLIVAMGNIACWALLGATAITRIRGAVTWSKALNTKVLPTFHPAHVLRNWNLRPIVVQDLLKARREAAFPEIRRPQRWVMINPTLDDIREWMTRPAARYAVDIETAKGQITMISFARSPADSIVIPFVVRGNQSYWGSREDEVRAWRLVGALLEDPRPKIFQFGLYDLTYLTRMGFSPRNCSEDTMLLSHALWPEMKKDLGFLGSVFTDEVSWKLMRTRAKDVMMKREE